MRLSATGSRELRAAVLAMKRADRDLRRNIYALMRDTMNPVWRDQVAAGSSTKMQRATIGTGVRVAAGNPPHLVAGSSKRALSKGRVNPLTPDGSWHIWEYGANRNRKATYTRRNRSGGGSHTVTRRVNAGKPARQRKGYVLGPAVAKIGPRAAALAVQSVVKAYMDILNPR
jgi:hypothetical protein